VLRFHADLRNAQDLAARLDRLAREPRWTQAVAADREAVLALFEAVFHHRAFTGRSGTMHAFEGQGSIYWHMVAKLLLAVQEVLTQAHREGAPAAVRTALGEGYWRVRAGLGFMKSPREYGAFPTDPYSHTPRHAGAQQPGMTGQVKEEVLTRFGELGVGVEAGRVVFRPLLLRRSEFLAAPASLPLPAGGALALAEGTLAFTLAGTPVVYRVGDEPTIRVVPRDGAPVVLRGDILDAAWSEALLARTGALLRVEVELAAGSLIAD
jgi:hypothetical protein